MTRFVELTAGDINGDPVPVTVNVDLVLYFMPNDDEGGTTIGLTKFDQMHVKEDYATVRMKLTKPG